MRYDRWRTRGSLRIGGRPVWREKGEGGAKSTVPLTMTISRARTRKPTNIHCSRFAARLSVWRGSADAMQACLYSCLVLSLSTLVRLARSHCPSRTPANPGPARLPHVTSSRVTSSAQARDSFHLLTRFPANSSSQPSSSSSFSSSPASRRFVRLSAFSEGFAGLYVFFFFFRGRKYGMLW